MKTVDFFGHKISRLILGDNPFNGWSYIPDEVSSEEMKAFYTDEKEIETLFAAEALGIQTMLPLSWPRTCGVLSEYYKRGGTMNLIFQGIASETPQENADHARQFAPHALAVYRNGSTLDYCCETGKFDEIRNTIKAYRDSGLIVGLASHVPSSIARAEDENWGV
ncbi:MAG: hypothetical protein LBG76_09070, partial [Treponema sp.]|nr:hypothetical protein [Treponema sp.]